MERLQGHINPYFFDRKPDLHSFAFKEEEEEENFQESVPFLQMLQSEEPSFLTLMSLKDPWELESYVSHEVPQFHSPVQSIEGGGNNQALSSQELVCNQANMIVPSSTASPRTANSKRKRKISELLPQETGREKRKRRRPIPSKNNEEIETQRINHIAVERNRRRQMNEHINSLRSILPPSYIQRGDQASIVGGAINYVKNLEQIIQSLESQRTTQRSNEGENRVNTNNHLLWTTQQEDQTCVPKIEATMIQNHVSLKIQCQKKQGQLLKGIISLEKLKLTVLHLNITSSTSSHSSVSYSFNLKMEDDCNFESAEEIKAAAHRIFEVGRFD